MTSVVMHCFFSAIALLSGSKPTEWDGELATMSIISAVLSVLSPLGGMETHNLRYSSRSSLYFKPTVWDGDPIFAIINALLCWSLF